MTTVTVPGLGDVEFPDGMSTADMESAIKAHMAQPVTVPQNEGAVESLTQGVRGANSALAQLIGAPVDLYNKYIGKPFAEAVTGRPQQDLPGGSATVRAGQNLAASGFSHAIGQGAPKQTASYADISEVPEHLRPAARAGEVTGSTLAMLAPVLGAAKGMTAADATAAQIPKATAGIIPNLWRSIVGQAAENPATFMASQVPSTVGQGAGAYAAESVFPGSPTAQLLGQLTGGGVGGVVSAGAKSGGNMVDRLYRNLTEPFTTQTEAGRATAIARRLEPEFAKQGEDAATILGRLQGEQVAPGLTAGQRAQSPTLTAVQENMAGQNPDLANKLAAGRQAYEQNMQRGLQSAFELGQPSALTAAAQARQASIQKHIEDTLGVAEQKASDAAMAVQPLDATARELANTKARNLLEEAVGRARGTERKLWQVPDKGEILPQEGTLQGYQMAKEGLLPGESLPAPIENAVAAIQTGKQIPSLGYLQNLRSRSLDMARDLRAGTNPNRDMARRLETFANGGVLTDLNASSQASAAAARDYSRALNDRITRSFAGDVLGMKPTGAERIRPELTLETAAAGGPAKAAQQFQELQTAMVPLRATAADMQSGAAMAPARQMQQMQEQFLRTVSQGVVGPDGRVDPKKIDALLKTHAPLLEQFPQYRQALETARDAQVAYQGVIQKTGDYAKATQQQGAFAKVLKAGENPQEAVAKVITGQTPVQDLSKMAALARMGGADAQGGLRASVLQHVMDQSTTAQGFSYGKANMMLNEPMSPNGPTLTAVLKDTGVLNDLHVAQIKKFLDAGMLDEAAKQASVQVGEFKGPGMWADAFARILGAKISSHFGLGKGGAGNSLQAAQIGANISKTLLNKLPGDKAKQFLAEALASDDPAKLQMVLERVGAYQAARNPSSNASTKALVLSRALALRNTNPQEPVDPETQRQVMDLITGRSGGRDFRPQGLNITVTPRR